MKNEITTQTHIQTIPAYVYSRVSKLSQATEGQGACLRPRRLERQPHRLHRSRPRLLLRHQVSRKGGNLQADM